MRLRHGLDDWGALLALTIIWGTAFAVIRLAVETVPPLTVAAGRIAVAALVLCAAVRLTGRRLPGRGSDWVSFLILATVGNALPFFLISWGQERVASGLAGILMAVNPIVTLVLAHLLVRGEAMTGARTAGFGLGFLGVIVLIGPGALIELGDGEGGLIRQAAVLGGALCYAANTILTRRLIDMHPLVASAAVLLVATVLIVPVAVVLGGPLSWSPSAESLAAVAWLGLVPTAVATILYFRLVASAGPTFLSLVNYPVPLIAVATGALVYAERLGWTAAAGLTLILFGIWLSQLSGSPGEEAPLERGA